MITAVDTNVLLDVFAADPVHGERSGKAVRRCLGEGSLVACEVVWAEVAASFPKANDARDAMSRLQVRFEAIEDGAALRAGSAWRSYWQAGGRRSRVIADFLIGAHALERADRLLTRDRGFFRTYFRGLRVLEPDEAPG